MIAGNPLVPEVPDITNVTAFVYRNDEWIIQNKVVYREGV
jgi:hypothetical protein